MPSQRYPASVWQMIRSSKTQEDGCRQDNSQRACSRGGTKAEAAEAGQGSSPNLTLRKYWCTKPATQKLNPKLDFVSSWCSRIFHHPRDGLGPISEPGELGSCPNANAGLLIFLTTSKLTAQHRMSPARVLFLLFAAFALALGADARNTWICKPISLSAVHWPVWLVKPPVPAVRGVQHLYLCSLLAGRHTCALIQCRP